MTICRLYGCACYVLNTPDMNDKNFEAEGSFYETCAEILGADHAYRPWTGRPPNRWNNRHPGNGRFTGFGTIKRFSANSIHVCLRMPKVISQMCKTEDEVYDLLRKLTQLTVLN